jgi:peptidyl-prolyl cis-trans isomerase B (cyclophilin B)
LFAAIGGSSSFELGHSFGSRYLSFVISDFMKILILTIAVIASTVFATEDKKEGTPTNSSNEVAVIKTNEGDMVVQFWTDAAGNTVDNFKKLARQGFYDGTTFHRIVKEFMIQGGDPNSKDPAKEDSYGQGGPGYNLKAEFNNHSHDRGVISMARGPDPDSAGSQFFICLAPVHRLDHQYTTFGKLIKGQDVLEKIGDTPVTRNSMGEPSKPTKRVVIESIKIVPADSVK